MAPPTRAQTSGDVTQPIYAATLYLTGAWGTDITGDITSAEHTVETSGEVSGIAFGTIVSPRATVTFNASPTASRAATRWRASWA
jgi:hypothetical protein